MQSGDQIIGEILNGQVDPFQFAPAMPWESPLPFVPRYLAKRLWPRGFIPLQPAARAPAPVVVPIQPAPAVNQVPRPPAPPRAAPPAPPKPQDRSLDPEMRTARSIRQVVKERRGFL